MTPTFWISCQTSNGEIVMFHSPTCTPDGIDAFGRVYPNQPGVIILPDADTAVEVYHWLSDLGWEYAPIMTGPRFTFMQLLTERGLR